MSLNTGTAYRLIGVENVDDVYLEDHRTQSLRSAVNLTLDAGGQVVLVEVIDRSVRVLKDDDRILDFTELRPGEKLQIGGDVWLLARPWQIILQKIENQQIEQENSSLDSVRTSILARAAVVALTLSSCGLFLGLFSHPWEQKVAKGAKVDREVIPVVLTTKTDSITKEDPNPPALVEVDRVPVQQPKPKQKAVNPAKKAYPRKKISKALRSQIEEALLEMRFDPESGRKKLRPLLGRLPRNSQLRQKVQGALAH